MYKVPALLIFLATSALWAQPATITPIKPSIKEECFQVGNVEELYGFAAARMGTDGFETDTTGCLELTQDIVVNKNVLNSDGDLAGDTASYIPWVPVSVFNGAVRGNGHTISGLFVKQDDREHNNIGFFGSFGGTIEDLHIEDSYIEDGGSTVYHYVGGFAGENYGKGGTRYGITIKNSSFSGTIISRSSAIGVGGFVGKNTAMITIEDSHTSGKITGTSSLGGFVGETDDIIITRSFNSANIETTNKYAGGLAGYASANFLCEIIITESYNKGNVKGYDAAGGLVGFAGYTKSKIVNSYNSGTLSARSHIGGIIGSTKLGENRDIYIYNSFNVGAINPGGGYTKYFGVLGELHSSDYHKIENTFFVKDTLYNDSSTFYGTALDASKFEDGSLLIEMQQFKIDSINGLVWGQAVGQDKHPVLTTRQLDPIKKKTNTTSGVKIFAESRSIKLDGLSPMSKFAVFDLRGLLLKKGITHSSSVSLEVPCAGTFIVQINGINKIVTIK